MFNISKRIPTVLLAWAFSNPGSLLEIKLKPTILLFFKDCFHDSCAAFYSTAYLLASQASGASVMYKRFINELQL